MNTAYREYLRDALKHYDRDDDKDAVRRFLVFLAGYQPQGGAVYEPGVYTYGDAQGQYVPLYVDEDGLRGHGVDLARVPDVPALLDCWSCTLGDMMSNEDATGAIPLDEALRSALDAMDIDPKTVGMEE